MEFQVVDRNKRIKNYKSSFDSMFYVIGQY